jgi:hypothetical protein
MRDTGWRADVVEPRHLSAGLPAGDETFGYFAPLGCRCLAEASSFLCRPPAQHHLTGSKSERPKEIEFCNDTQYLAFFHDWEGIEVVLLKQRLQLAHRDLARHGLHGARHI